MTERRIHTLGMLPERNKRQKRHTQKGLHEDTECEIIQDSSLDRLFA